MTATIDEPRARPDATAPSRAVREVTYRHSLLTRITHWVNAVAFIVLLMTGLQIFNAHPALYWGESGSNVEGAPTLLEMRAEPRPGGAAGVTQIGSRVYDTTGVFGLSQENGRPSPRGFPAWATIPSNRDLTSGRLWHFFFAWVLVLNGLTYLLANAVNGDLRRKLWPTGAELRHIGASIWEHIRFRWPAGQEAKKYNVIQKLTYLIVLLALFPLVVLTGTTMSPGLNAAFPFMLDVFGGRQSARTLHFIAAALLTAFLLVHVALVLVSGVWNNMRSMITGRYVITERPAPDAS